MSSSFTRQFARASALYPAFLATLPLFFLACSTPSAIPENLVGSGEGNVDTIQMLRVLGPERTGITFSNTIVEDSLSNYFKYIHTYNGGGVAAGDLDGDGLPEIAFTSNRSGGAIYHNEGGLRFKDVSAAAGFDLRGIWAQGIVMVDANADGRLDIFVCGDGPADWPVEYRQDRLYINQGGMRFVDEAKERGVADNGHSTSACFGDLDQDGDLDLFIIGHRSDFQDLKRAVVDPRYQPVPDQTNRLYINDGTGHFVDRTAEAGLMSRRFGLGAVLGDMDGDGLTDIYSTCDFYTANMMMINDGKSGPGETPHFTDQVLDRIRHISYFAMGVDRADFNNDGLADLYELDMTPGDHVRSKENMASMRPTQFSNMVQNGMHRQYMVNTLNLNLGNGHYAEMAQLAGVDKTDWSWAPLFVDIDNDGWKDLYVTNGVERDVTNSDFRDQVKNIAKTQGTYLDFRPILDLAPQHQPEKVVFRNKGDLTFEKMMDKWDYHHVAVTVGATYADLDADGDIDFVTVDNNVPGKVVENLSRQKTDAHYLQLVLKGGANNPNAIGSKVTVKNAAGMQVVEAWSCRGFQGSVEPLVHFGLGQHDVDTLIVDWYDGTRTVMLKPGRDKRITVDMSTAERGPKPSEQMAKSLFVEATSTAGLGTHTENQFDDFAREPLLPQVQSEHGPAGAVADVDGDGLDDVFIGAATGTSPTLYLQSGDGRFRKAKTQPWSAHRSSEVIGAHFFDADGDDDQDIYLAAGSTEFPGGSSEYQGRLYVNNGKGAFSEAPGAIPASSESSQCIASQDLDDDGDLDLFVGGRNIPGFYPMPPMSRVLINEQGRFTDATSTWLPEMERLGMITGARFADLDGDKKNELVLVAEWKPVQVLRNSGQRFIDATASMIDTTVTGWWQGLEVNDLDNDGDLDILAGNLGLNNKFHPSKERPLKLYTGDLDGNGSNDIVLAKTSGHGELPVRGRECSSQQCPVILDKFPTYKAFAAADLEEIYGADKLTSNPHFQATEFKSMILRNDGHGKFTFEALPIRAQFSPTRSFVVRDINGDGNKDIVLAGNIYNSEVETVSYDGGVGLVMLGDGKHGFVPLTVQQSGVFAPYDTRHVLAIDVGPRHEASLLVVNNNGPVQLFTPSSATVPRSPLAAR